MRLHRLQRAARRVLSPVARSHLRAWRDWRRGEAELRLLPQLVDPGRVALDVGAYLGSWTFFLARRARAVHAFEPQPAAAAFLRAAYGDRVTVHECAVGERDGEGWLEVPAAGATSPSAVWDNPVWAARMREREPGRGRIPIAVRRLDGLELGDVGFVKVDAEGTERQVLAGARALIGRCRPVLLVEVEQRCHEVPIGEVLAEIEGYGYAGRFLLDGRLRPLAEFSVAGHQQARLAGDRSRPYVNNFVFFPRQPGR